MSTVYCGCDWEANYMCAKHKARLDAYHTNEYAAEAFDQEADVNDYKGLTIEEKVRFSPNEPAPLSPDGRYDWQPVRPYKRPADPDGFNKMFAATPTVGIGGAPTRATTLPTEGAARKQFPIASGVLDYFPDALVAVANVSWAGNEQHNPGQPLHWARGKSTDESDTMIRHFLQRGTLDVDGQRHSAKMVWRALAILQKEIEGESK